MGAAIPQEGTTSNRYAILGRIATGGMAEIFLARATSLAGVERHVVLKRILPERTRDPLFVKMFLDEARLAAQLQHPNIAQVHDIGRLGESYFFTMEYVHGEDLRSVLQRLSALRRVPPINHALLIAAGAAAALHHAHERTAPDRTPLGIVHRDVSPSNVMVGFEGAVKLVDFGVAKATQRSTETRTGTVKGKIAYLSPEQCQGTAIDRRSDVFSLGIVLYELLTCTRLYRRDSDFQTMTAIVNEPAPPASRVRPDLTPEIDAVVATALARDPARRFQTAGEMLEAIEAAAEHAGKTMSPHALGRFLRELFGERPEPWIEISERDDMPEVITVTSQSVIHANALAGVSTVPHRTQAPSTATDAANQDIEHELRRTTQLRKPGDPYDPGEESGSSMPQVRPLGSQWTGPTAAVGPNRTIRSSSAPPPMNPPRGSAPSFPPPVGRPGSGSSPPPFGAPEQPAPGSYPSYSELSVSGAGAGPRPRRRSLGVVIGVAAIVIGVGIGVYFATREPPPLAPGTFIDAAPPIALAAVADAAPAPDTTAIAAATDAAPAPAPPPDAAAAAAPASDPVGDALAAITAAAGTGSWSQVSTACDSIKRKDLTLDARAACMQAACVGKQRSDAIELARGLPRARRAPIEKVCKAKGVNLDRSSGGKDRCEIDPLSCQH